MTGENSPMRLAIAGGGTGGHVFPGVAVAEALDGFTPVEIMWIGTGRPVEEQALRGRGWEHRVLKVRPLAGRGWAEKMLSLCILPLSVARAMVWLHAFRPHVVLGVGGYVAGPVLVAAKLMGIPTALHEQNVTPGLTNRMSGRFADVIFISFPQTERSFPGRKVICTGNPVRRDILEAAGGELQLSHDPGKAHRILVLGGSQGARAINTMVSSALLLLWNSGVKLQVVHQTGPEEVQQIKKIYEDAGLKADVLAFISSVGEKLAWADLVISRAGAGTLSELTAVGRAAILIPYPHAAGGHQEFNARELSQAGAAIFFREDDIGAVKLSAAIQELLDDPNRISGMAKKARRLGRPDAADIMARELMNLSGLKRVSNNPSSICESGCGYSRGIGAENV